MRWPSIPKVACSNLSQYNKFCDMKRALHVQSWSSRDILYKVKDDVHGILIWTGRKVKDGGTNWIYRL